ncbi:MAG: TonB-dependent receptor [Opitutales bacterium]
MEAAPFALSDEYAIVAVDIVNETELQRLAAASLGETLGWQAGVSSSYFGPAASRPVIRGLEGVRLRTLQDGIGTLDVSDVSPDHGVALEPLLVQKIDIHRGPSALLFGNAAIGGAVNAQSRLLLEEPPKAVWTGEIETAYDTASEGRHLAGYGHLSLPLDVTLTFAGATRESEDYEIPGRARTELYQRSFDDELPPLVRDPETNQLVPIPNPEGELPNSFHQGSTASGAVNWLPTDHRLRAGFAFTSHHSTYGIPYQYSGGPNDPFGFDSLELQQTRYDTEMAVEPGAPWLREIRFRLGYADYKHQERFDGQGPNADLDFSNTEFEQLALEARVDLYHEPFSWWRGVAGVNGRRRDLETSRLVFPPNESTRVFAPFATKNLGFYIVETLTVGGFTLQGGARYETQTILNEAIEEPASYQNTGGESYSAAASLTWRRYAVGPLDELAVTPAISYSERLPTAIERFAFWPNAAIQRFLIGGDFVEDPADRLTNESAVGLEIGIEARRNPLALRINGFRYDYDNFIFIQDLRGIGNLAQFVGREASFYGFEGELSWLLQPTGGSTLTLTAMSDFVRGNNDTSDQPLPRIPPLRAGVRAEYAQGPLSFGLELRHAFAQDRLQPGDAVVRQELPTDSYTEINFDASYDFALGPTSLTAFVQAKNLLDAERRIHTSFLKDVAPLPGRSFDLGLRWSF